MTIGDLQNLTMLAVARLGPRAFAREIREMLGTVAEREVSVSTVFVTLTRLEDRGLLTSEPGETPTHGGRATRIFSLTEPGWEALREARGSANRMWAGLEPG